MWIVARRSFGEPGHEVEVLGAVEREGIAIEDVNDQSQVAVGSKLICHELAVLPNTQNIRNVEQADALVLLVGRRGREVAVVLSSNFDMLACRGAPE